MNENVAVLLTYALPLWTLLVWGTRIRNVVQDDGVGWSLLVPLGMTVLAVAALVERRRLLLVLAAATVGLWAVRLPLVLVHDHGAAFKVVHAVLAVASVALAIVTSRASVRHRTPPPAFTNSDTSTTATSKPQRSS